jgi:hypothetical protein
MTVDIKDDAKVATFKGSLKDANADGGEHKDELHAHTHGGGCCSGHECQCARATQNIVKSFLPLLGVSSCSGRADGRRSAPRTSSAGA